ncbi:hypothetical protein AFC81_02550 [Mycobacterium avium subsp. paratuberculosis]|nr:hypothetical protein AFC81_02550 [Mycobacterium avium subsp. paratuberculosis]OHW74303.1 hypothetical protein AFC82_04605 [Mycobacterium avium subsp. paratuberculosis]OHW75339.1 hypothetical protein AFC79_03500 [Mycobacterium avium subsp. paratuberculosis]OHW82801.1 hypothetical protein AFC83_03755 [Mycobacterium avium subsp. paratuberculosis]OHW87159.1 hypothetical protein AFC85_04600 [Mycobacterium avium subsp. paratuberculosis]
MKAWPTWLSALPTGVPCKKWSHSLPAQWLMFSVAAATADTVASIWPPSVSASRPKLSTTVRMSSAIFLISSSSSSVSRSQTSLIPVSGSQMRDNRSRIAACTWSTLAA